MCYITDNMQNAMKNCIIFFKTVKTSLQFTISSYILSVELSGGLRNLTTSGVLDSDRQIAMKMHSFMAAPTIKPTKMPHNNNRNVINDVANEAGTNT